MTDIKLLNEKIKNESGFIDTIKATQGQGYDRSCRQVWTNQTY